MSSLDEAVQEHFAESGPIVGWVLVAEVATGADGSRMLAQRSRAVDGTPLSDWQELGYLEAAAAVARDSVVRTTRGEE